MNTMQSLFNLIRIKGSDKYKNAVPPLADMSPIGDVMTPILNDLAIYKEFTSLLGAWIKDEIFRESWTHPVIADIVKNGNGLPTGNYTRQIANNPVNPTKYDPAHPEHVLEQKFTKDLVNFYVRNVYDKFKISFPFEEIQQAFSTYENAQDYVAMKKASLESGGNFATFNHLKECIFANRQNGGLHVETLPKTIKEMNSEDWLEVGKQIETFTRQFPFLSSDYIAYNNLTDKVEDFYGFARKEDVRIIATVDFLTSYSYEALANMFNMSIGELKTITHEVDTFDYPIYNYNNGSIVGMQKTDIQCIVCDIRGLKATIDMEKDEPFFNVDTLVTTIYKHKWSTFAMSPFNKCVVFVDPASSTSNYIVTSDSPVVQYGNPQLLDLSQSNVAGPFDVVVNSIEIDGSTIDIVNNGHSLVTEIDNGVSILDSLDTGAVVNQLDAILYLMLDRLLNSEIQFQYTDTSGEVVQKTYVTSSTFDIGELPNKNTPILVKRKDNNNLLYEDSYTYDEKVFTIDEVARERFAEMYPNLHVIIKYNVVCNDTTATGSPITTMISPYSNREW